LPREFDHLALPAAVAPLERRRRGGGRTFRRPDEEWREHSREMREQAEALAESLDERRMHRPVEINPRLTFRLVLHGNGNLGEEDLERLGLRLIARMPGNAIVVFPDDETLAEFRLRIASYAGDVPDAPAYRGLDSIEAIEELTAADRVGHALATRPLAANETEAVDVELWRSPAREECERWIGEITSFVEAREGRVTDRYIGDALCLLRVRLTGQTLQALLEVDYVKQIDRRPEPEYESLAVELYEADTFDAADDPPADIAGVVVADSGVAQRHPLLAAAMADAQAFLDDGLGPEDVDAVAYGHGTAVAGFAVHGDPLQAALNREPPKALLFSARILGEELSYDEDALVERQLEALVDYFTSNYPRARVVNLSLGNSNSVFVGTMSTMRLAAVVDELAYRYRDREIVFVISTGNYRPDHLTADETKRDYPAYLLDDRAKILDPGTAALAITVGGLAYGVGTATHPLKTGERDIDSFLAMYRDWPSPFTRTGPGPDGAIKPEVVDYAGDARHDRTGIRWDSPGRAGIPTANRNFGPPTGRVLRTVAGTSFAAPRVSNLAARLFTEFPDASSNMVRALIAESAELPDSRPDSFAGEDEVSSLTLRIYGYGRPDFDRARWSAENHVVLVSDGVMPVDSVSVFEVPPLPAELLQSPGSGRLSVTLAFDPPVRHTRADSYLGVRMDARLYRNVEPSTLAEVLRRMAPDEREALQEGEEQDGLDDLKARVGRPIKIDLRPGVRTRQKGTLQRGWANVGRSDWNYDGGPLTLAVTAQRTWAPDSVVDQRYAIVVSLKYSRTGVDLYARWRERLSVFERVRARVGT